MRSPSSPGRRGRRGRSLLAVAVVLQLTAGLTAAVLLQEPDAPVAPVVRARALPPELAADSPTGTDAPAAGDATAQRAVAVEERTAAVRRLLAARSAAVRGRDRAAFLATVDPAASALRARQAAVFDALEQVPLGTWDYVLDAGTSAPADPVLDVRYGSDRWWAPPVSLRHAIAGFDERPTVVAHQLTFVRRGERWLLGADDDFAAAGRATPRALWDHGPVVAERAPGVLVLAHPATRDLARNVARLSAAAISQVTAVWGPAWQRRVVVVVPSDTTELAGLLGSDADLSRIAAVATAELTGTADYDPAGDRVLINPGPFLTLSQTGRAVVLAHEVTHVATRRATGPAVPAWLAEGLADHVAYLGVDVPLSVAARELRQDVRAGRLPSRLPADTDFDGSSPGLSQAYEQSWLAVRLIAERHGQPALLRFYRSVGAARGVDPEEAVEAALRTELGTTPGALVADWQAALRRQLG